MVSKKMTELQPWECLMKRIVWKQLGDICDKKILDFGSGIGVTANYLAEHNDVTAIEPDADSIKERWADNQYTQIDGMLAVLFHRKMLHPPKKVSAPYRVETFLKFK